MKPALFQSAARYAFAGIVAFSLGCGVAHADFISTTLALDPVGFWPLDDSVGSGSAVNLATSGSTYNGSASNVGFGVAGPPGAASAASFNGSSSYIAIPDQAASPLHVTSFTVEGWVDPLTTMGIATVYAQRRGAGGTGISLALQSDNIALSINDFSHNIDVTTSSNPVATNAWTFLSASYNHTSGTIDLYLNGDLVDSANVGALNVSAIYTGLGPLIGEEFFGSDQRYFDGSIADVALFNDALTGNEIAAQYSAAVPEPSSVALLSASLAVLAVLLFAPGLRRKRTA